MQKTITFLFIFFAFLSVNFAQTSNTTTLVSHFDFKKANTLLANNSTYTHKYSLAYYERDKAYYEQKVTKYKKMKTVGIVLSSLGGAALVGTIAGTAVLARKADFNDYYYSNGSTYYYDGSSGAGKTIGMAVGGAFLTAALLGPGIPLSIIGANKYKKYKAKLAGL